MRAVNRWERQKKGQAETAYWYEDGGRYREGVLAMRKREGDAGVKMEVVWNDRQRWKDIWGWRRKWRGKRRW